MSTVIQIQKISKDTFALPDGTIVYTMAKAIKEYKKIKPVKYTLSDLILILLYSQPQVIRGQKKFFRQMFFLDRLVFRKQTRTDLKFVRYNNGPYSFQVANKLNHLVALKLVEKTRRGGSKTDEFKITPASEKKIERKYAALSPKTRDEIEKIRKGIDQLGIIKPINYKKILKEYQDLTMKTGAGERYKLISWGKS